MSPDLLFWLALFLKMAVTAAFVVGASIIGRLVIEALARTDLELAVYDPYLTAAEAARLGVEKVDDLTELYDSVVVIRDGRLCFEGSVEAFMSQAPHASDRPVEAAYLRVIESAR